MTKLYSYIRFSSAKQSEGSSFERQIAMARKVALEHGLELVTDYQDLGVSAFKGANSKTGALSRFLDEIGRSVPVGSWLFIENLDRLSRADIVTAQELFLSIIRRGITIVTGMDNKVYSLETVNANPLDLLISIMMFTRGNEESQTKRNRTNASALLKIKKHQENPQVPAVAIEEVGKNMWWTDTTSGYVEPHPIYFPIVKKIIQLKKDGYSTGAVLEYLNDHYTPPAATSNKRHDKWSISMVSRLFATKALIGIKTVTVDGVKYELENYYPRVISDSEYYQLKDTITKKAWNYSYEADHIIALLTGIGVLKCGHCGTSMIKQKGGNGKVEQYRYACDCRRSGKGDCPHPNWGFRACYLDNAVLHLIADKIWIEEEKTNQIPELKGRIAEISSKIDNLIALSAMTGATPELAGQINGLNSQREALQQEIAAQERDMYTINTKGWEKLAEFDISDVRNEGRLKIREKIKQAVKLIKCYRVNKHFNLFLLEYKDGKTTRIVLENQRGKRPAKVYLDVKAINDRQILESNGLILHPCLDMLIDKDWQPEEEQPGLLQEFGI